MNKNGEIISLLGAGALRVIGKNQLLRIQWDAENSRIFVDILLNVGQGFEICNRAISTQVVLAEPN